MGCIGKWQTHFTTAWSNTSVQYLGNTCIYFLHGLIHQCNILGTPVFSFAHLAGLMFIGLFLGHSNTLCVYLQTACVSQCKPHTWHLAQHCLHCDSLDCKVLGSLGVNGHHDNLVGLDGAIEFFFIIMTHTTKKRNHLPLSTISFYTKLAFKIKWKESNFNILGILLIV